MPRLHTPENDDNIDRSNPPIKMMKYRPFYCDCKHYRFAHTDLKTGKRGKCLRIECECSEYSGNDVALEYQEVSRLNFEMNEKINTAQKRTKMEKSDIDEVLIWFSDQMRSKLYDNTYKGGWRNDDLIALFRQLEVQTFDLRDSIDSSYDEMIKRCINIANFAMFIADNANIQSKGKNKMENQILTVGELRKIMATLDDACHVEVNIDGQGFGYIYADAENDGDTGWLSIIVD